MSEAAERIFGLYDDKADDWVADRGRTLGRGGAVLNEAAMLERFVAAMPPGGSVLDVGCGSGWPWGAALLDRKFRVTGVDASPRLVAHATRTLPAGEWIVGDMRTFDLRRTFDGLLVWYSLFHLTPDDQRTALARILAHAAPKATLLMTAGWGEAGVSVGQCRGEPRYHASLALADYETVLRQADFATEHQPETPASSRVTLAQRAFLSAD